MSEPTDPLAWGHRQVLHYFLRHFDLLMKGGKEDTSLRELARQVILQR
jgi:hypothetical protein